MSFLDPKVFFFQFFIYYCGTSKNSIFDFFFEVYAVVNDKDSFVEEKKDSFVDYVYIKNFLFL